jgi:hypothetical protein
MTKKLFSTVAAAAVLASGAMAFDNIDTGVLSKALPYKVATTSASAANSFTIGTRGEQGDSLIFPAFNVGSGWETTLRVINTSSTNAVVAKVVLYAGDDSRELRDFNIYLSANDVWVGTIKIDTDGVAKVISTDESSPLTGGTMASATNPMKSDAVSAASGYIEVIGCAAAVDEDYNLTSVTQTKLSGYVKTATAHGDHANLRANYKTAAAIKRNTVSGAVFSNGVITSGANVPGVDANLSIRTEAATTTAPAYEFGDVPNVLTGDVRITDTVNGKDMVLPAVVLKGVTDSAANTNLNGVQPMALMYVEGEAANIADRAMLPADSVTGLQTTAITTASTYSEYDYKMMSNDASDFNITNVFMTYGDSSSAVNNQLLLTSPYKRLLVNADSNLTANSTIISSNGHAAAGALGTNAVGGIYSGVTADSTGASISSYGYNSALALIFDQAENQADSSQFSPANTAVLKFNYELSASEGNTVETDNLSFYLGQSGYAAGFVDLQFRNATSAGAIPAIPTQMMATTAASKVITNWIVPAYK